MDKSFTNIDYANYIILQYNELRKTNYKMKPLSVNWLRYAMGIINEEYKKKTKESLFEVEDKNSKDYPYFKGLYMHFAFFQPLDKVVLNTVNNYENLPKKQTEFIDKILKSIKLMKDEELCEILSKKYGYKKPMNLNLGEQNEKI